MQKILIIEDDPFIRDIYLQVLTDAGYTVTTAVDGEEGLVKVQNDDYALILLDLMTPKVTGIEFLKSFITKDAVPSTTKVILLTNVSQSGVIQEGLDLGASGFIIKSDIDPGQLVAKVKDLLAA